MAKAKSQNCTWYCKECNKANYISKYNKTNNDKIKKELNKFCNQCKATTLHKRKDTKKAVAK